MNWWTSDGRLAAHARLGTPLFWVEFEVWRNAELGQVWVKVWSRAAAGRINAAPLETGALPVEETDEFGCAWRREFASVEDAQRWCEAWWGAFLDSTTCGRV